MNLITPITEPPDDISALVRASLAEGHTFVERMHTHWLDGSNRFDQPGEAYFAVHRDGQLVAVGGINRDPYAETPAGRVRHFYVLPAFRRHGIGRALLEHVVAHGCAHFDLLRLRTLNPEADTFYRACGFTAVDDPQATHILRCG